VRSRSEHTRAPHSRRSRVSAETQHIGLRGMGEVKHASQRRMAPIAALTVTRFVSTPTALRQHAGLGAANASANRTVLKLQTPNGVAPSELQTGKVRLSLSVCVWAASPPSSHLLTACHRHHAQCECALRAAVAVECAHDRYATLKTATPPRARWYQVLRTDGERGNGISVATAGARAAAFPRLGAARQPASTAGAPGSKAAAGGRGVSLVWFRADLRTHDHEPLAAAAAESTSLVPVFIFGTYALVVAFPFCQPHRTLRPVGPKQQAPSKLRATYRLYTEVRSRFPTLPAYMLVLTVPSLSLSLSANSVAPPLHVSVSSSLFHPSALPQLANGVTRRIAEHLADCALPKTGYQVLKGLCSAPLPTPPREPRPP
jgi:hypothetical protein